MTEMKVERFSIVGTAFCEGGDQIIGALKPGDELTLVREPTNKHDPLAVAVYAGDGRIGYIPRAKNKVLSQFIDQDGEPSMAFDGNKTVKGKYSPSANSGFPMIEV